MTHTDIKPSHQPRIIFGMMGFGQNKGVGIRNFSLDEYRQTMDEFKSRGYNEVDTARFYDAGNQEAWATKAGWKERNFKLATKCLPVNNGDHRPEKLRESIETSLKALETDCLDIFYLHAPDRATPWEETFAELDKIHREGKIKEVGLSNFAACEVAEIATLCKERGWVRPTIYQGNYNAINRNINSELIPCCHHFGIDVVTYGPLGGGFFTGKYRKDKIPDTGRFSDESIAGKYYRARYWNEGSFQALEAVEKAAKKHDLSLIEVALRWVRYHSELNVKDGGNDGIIIGPSGPEQAKQCLDLLEKGPLPDDVVEALDYAWRIAAFDSESYFKGQLIYGPDAPSPWEALRK
ncbi:hypothetical protein KEM55_007463 [Ascosphaera atra]|nr:hypothetical protein KEM55_007463 [Ascosphaera atra]